MTNFPEILIEVTVNGVIEEIEPSPKALKLATVDFNPSNDERIDLVKIVAAAFIQLVLDHGEGRAANVAMTRIEEAKMWTVLSVIHKMDTTE